MIGIGKWSFNIVTMMFRGSIILTIAEENGTYAFSAEVPDLKLPEYSITDVREDGNTLTAVVKTPVLSGKDLPISLTFDGDVCTGFAKVPLLGKIKLKNGQRVE